MPQLGEGSVPPGSARWSPMVAPAFAGSMIVGLLCGYWEIPAVVWICAWAIWISVAFVNHLALRLSPRYRARMVLVAAMVGAAGIGAAGVARMDSLAEASVARFAGRNVVLRGAVVSSRAGGRSPEAVIAASSVDADGSHHQVAGRVRVFFQPGDASCRLAESLRYGDITEGSVQLELASRPMNPGEPDLRAVFLQNGIHALANVDSTSVRVVGRRRLNPVERVALWVREGIVAAARATLASGPREVFLAMALGDSGELDYGTLESFRRAGVSHLLAASGLHVSLVVGLAMQAAAAAGLSSRRSSLAGFLIAGVYAVAAGLRPSIVRAWLMFGLSALASACGRRVSAVHVVCVAAAVQLILDPLLLWNAGFQMSYLAIIALFYLAPCFARIVPPRWPAPAASMLRTLLASTAVGAALLPIVANMTLEVSLIGPIANLIAVPMGLVAMTAGLGGCVIWHVWPWLGSVMNAGSEAVLIALASFVRIVASVPLSSVPIRMFSPWETGAYYVVLSCACAIGSDAFRRYRFRRAVGGIARRPASIACGVGLLFLIAFRPAPFEVVVMSVGQGDAIFVSTPGGANVLIDAGAAWAGDKHVVPYLARRGIRRLDLLVITHEHADHAGGVGAVAGRIRTECVAVPSCASGPTWDGILAGLAAARGGKSPRVIRLSQGSVIRAGGVTLEALNPPPAAAVAARGLGSDANEGSVVLRISYRHFSMLLAADAGARFERRILDEPLHRSSLAAQVVKIGHHGSSGGSSSRFLEAVGPRLAIVSVGRNGYGHPSPAAVSRILDYGAELRRTDMCGAVSISIALHTAGQVAGGQVDYRARDMRSVWAKAPLFRKLGV
ncbi:MAG: DNA internalization-related competence protein ComEC/Rec2 [Firmicutes bacterium]|nr:DNA internalization-related competence protein ComEC/Rec2 [Bacillota bacterium]